MKLLCNGSISQNDNQLNAYFYLIHCCAVLSSCGLIIIQSNVGLVKLTEYDYFLIGSVSIPLVLLIFGVLFERNKISMAQKINRIIWSVVIWACILAALIIFGKATDTSSAILRMVNNDNKQNSALTAQINAQETYTPQPIITEPASKLEMSEPSQPSDVKKLSNPVFGEPCYAYFGVYPQNNGEEATPILWRVLQATDQEATILCHDIVFYQSIVSNGSQPWLSTDLYEYLNTTFMRDAFTEAERNYIVRTDHGFIYLLSLQEAKNSLLGFADEKDRKAIQTEYASNQRNSQENAWWLLPDSAFQADNPYVKENGVISNLGKEKRLGVRPVCTIDLARVTIAAGDGTVNDPYRIE